MHANTVNKVVRFIVFYANLHKKTDSHTITAVYNDYLHLFKRKKEEKNEVPCNEYGRLVLSLYPVSWRYVQPRQESRLA